MPHHTEYLHGLRQKGHRLTPQREMILSVICEGKGHLTADEIIRRVRQRYPRFHKSAVYRTLDLLTRYRLVNPTDLGQGCITYEIHRDPHHHHLICRTCGKMTEASESIFTALEQTLRNDYGFLAEFDHFAIWGTCAKCQSKRRPSKPARKKHVG